MAATGYGYLHIKAPASQKQIASSLRVQEFCEKPSALDAEKIRRQR